MQDWISFYETFFPSPEEAQKFVHRCETLAPTGAPVPQIVIAPKIMMHQTQRLVSLGDDVKIIRPGHDALQLLFYLVCAENIAKLFDDFDKEGQSRKYVRMFFAEFLEQEEKEIIATTFLLPVKNTCLDLDGAIDLLYDVRCNVVHDGLYWRFSFAAPKKPAPMSIASTKNDLYIVIKLQKATFRSLLIKGCIRAISRKLNEPRRHLGTCIPAEHI